MQNKIQSILAMLALTCANVAVASDFDTIAPSDVSNVVVEEVSETEIELSWDKATDNVSVEDYKVYYGKSSVKTDGGYYDLEELTDSTKTNYILENLEPDTIYYIAITALDANENESYNYSIEVSATTEEAEVLHEAADEEEEEEDEPNEPEKIVEPGNVSAELSVDKVSGSAPLTVQFDARESEQKDGAIASYAWDYNSDGIVDSNLPSPSYTFTESGVYDVSLVVTGTDGQTDTAETTITVWDTEVVEYVDPEVVEPEVEDEPAVEVVDELVETNDVATSGSAEDNLPETGPALLIPALVAGAGALLTRKRK